MKRNKKIIALAIVAGISLFGFNSKKAFADEEVKKFGVQISPSIQRTGGIDPGSTYSNKIAVVNTTTEPVDIEMVAEPYFVENNTYSPTYSTRNNFTEIANWVEIADYDTHLEPGEGIEVNYTVNVPANMHGGGQYAVIFAQAKKSNEGDESVHAIARSGMILFSKVNGTINESGKIIETKTDSFLLAPPVKASVKLSNTGNIDTEARITVDIENAITGGKLYSNSNEPISSTLFPETEKTVNLEYDNVLRLGIMKMTMRIEYLNEAEVVTRTIIVCPIWFIFILVAIILLIIAKIVSKKHSNDKKRSNSRGFENPSKNFNI